MREKGLRSKEETDKSWLEAQVSRTKKDCRKLHYERFQKPWISLKFVNLKTDFLAKRLTTIFYCFLSQLFGVFLGVAKLYRRWAVA